MEKIKRHVQFLKNKHQHTMSIFNFVIKSVIIRVELADFMRIVIFCEPCPTSRAKCERMVWVQFFHDALRWGEV